MAGRPGSRAAAITFATTAIGYALALCPALYWLDSGELAAASFELGVAHAPGQPLALLVGKLLAFVPLGSLPLRVGLGQVLCGAAAAAVLAALGTRVAALFLDEEPAQAWLGAAAGLAYGGSYAAGFQAIRPEVYALSALLVLGALAFALRWYEGRAPGDLGLCGLCIGLGLCNHHYLVLLGALPPIAALLVGRLDPSTRAGLRRGALAGLGALALYLYLPLRAAHDPVFDWGHPTGPGAFVWTVSARSFHKSVTLTHDGDLVPLVGALLEQLTPAAPLLALGGLYLSLRRAPRLGVALALALAGPIVARLLVPFDARNPDAFAYLSTAIAALALLCLPLVAALAGRLPSRARRLLAPALCLASLGAFAVRTRSFSLASIDEARPIFAGFLSTLPPASLVVPSYFQTTFSIDALRVLDGMRPDVLYLPRHHLDHPGAVEALRRRDPRLAPFLEGGRLDVEALLRGEGRVLVEYDLDLDRRLLGKAGVLPTPARMQDVQTRRFALWQAFLHLHQLCRMGAGPADLQPAEARLRRHLDPEGDPDADALVAACPSLRGR